ERQRLLTDPTPWAMPPEDLVTEEAERRVSEAARAGISESTFWGVLGLHAAARSPLTESQLRAMGLWVEGTTATVLALARNFFRPRPRLQHPHLAYEFDHPGYQRVVLEHVDAVEVHRQLGEACVRSWAEGESAARGYTLRYAAAHWREGRRW